MIPFDRIKAFYLYHLPEATLRNQRIYADCPFCNQKKNGAKAKLIVHANPDSYFRGYFHCSQRCVNGGFHFHFAQLLNLSQEKVPGYDSEDEGYIVDVQYPTKNLQTDIDQFISLIGEEQHGFLEEYGISEDTLKQMRIGFNGRYLVFPYYQDNDLVYAARCVFPGRDEDFFWHGNETFSKGELAVFNAQEINRCQGGALFVTHGELNLLILKELGYPGIAVPSVQDLVHIAPERLKRINHIFLLTSNLPQTRMAARQLAVQLGFKARILTWPSDVGRGDHLSQVVYDEPKEIKKKLASMISRSQSFSPFESSEKEQRRLMDLFEKEKGKNILGLETGFGKLDGALDGLRGITILGGPPKAGKSCFFMQISTEVARRKVPVIYYDFENGRQKIYLRTLVRLSSLPEKRIRKSQYGDDEANTLKQAWAELDSMLRYFRVVTDRELTPEIMLRHIEFIKHETRNDDVLVVIDSLHKLPFKDLKERRTGIDSWLRQFESIRDNQQVSFLVISELSRGKEGGYNETPDLSSFKESGDIEYSADNAMILTPSWDPFSPTTSQQRQSTLWVVASRENSPGKVAEYKLDFPYWRFKEM
ncbi:MAG: AAA family ATPase [Desulfobacteraceae bacterium]|nr:AAA family ATPase [Desulfobacteraceae bacterium]